jgi:hypothetical protein
MASDFGIEATISLPPYVFVTPADRLFAQSTLDAFTLSITV